MAMAGGPDLGDATLRRPRPGPGWATPLAAAPEPEPQPRPSRRRALAAAIGSAVVALVGGGIVWMAVTAGSQPQPSANPTQTVAAPQAAQRPPAPIAVTGQVTGETVVFTWTNPQPQEGDAFQYRYERSDADPVTSTVPSPTVTLERDADGESCILVSLVRADGRSSNDTKGCVDG